MNKPSVLLQMQGVSKRFGATQALADVSLDVRAGEILALIGENGAGKSTLMKILSGVHSPDSGSIELLGRSYRPDGPAAAIRLGAAMIYQELNLAPDLSVEDNVMLGQERKRIGLLNRAEQQRLVKAALARLGRSDLRLDAIVGRLSVGTQQIVEIARALVQDAKVIIFDEPTSSLASDDVKSLFKVVRSLKAAGLGVVYISHFLEEISELCDRYVVLRDGRVAGSGQVAGTTEPEIVRLMVGRSVDQLYPHVPHQRGETLLEVQGLTGDDDFPSDVSFTLARGEILGLAGLVGAGRTEVLRAIMALDPVKRGTVRVNALSPAANPTARNRAGLGLVSEDRKGEGLAQTRSIADNLTYSRLGPYSFWGVLNLAKRTHAVREWMKRLQVKAHSSEQPIAQLSGGNQQKVAIARVMHQEADVLLLDEPTRGIDVGTKAEIYRLVGELAASGKAIIFVSSYLSELLATCDRVGVMSRGRLKEIRPAAEWTEETALACAVGSDERA